MIAVIFEVWPADGRRDSYLDHASRLRPELEKIDGFLSVERFQSLTDPGKMLSLSFWRDEAAVARSRHAGRRPQRRVPGLPAPRRNRGARLRHERAPGTGPARQPKRARSGLGPRGIRRNPDRARL
jgi:quinol monooxygenase YgiN